MKYDILLLSKKTRCAMYLTYHYLKEYPDSMLVSSTVVARCKGKWCFGWRGGYLLPSTEIHDDLGESAEDAARRLLSEMGALRYELIPVNIYAIRRTWEEKPLLDMLYFAEIHSFETSAKELIFSETLPESAPKTDIGAYLFSYVTDFLSPKNEIEERWDVYDKGRNLTGRTHRRGDLIPDGDYHLVVHSWVQNTDGRILLTQRSANKGYPHLWECSGGAAVVGEDSLTAAVREVFEETGITVLPEQGKLVKTMRRINDHVDIWLFRSKIDMTNIRLQERETCDAKLVTIDELRHMAEQGKMARFTYLDELISKL